VSCELESEFAEFAKRFCWTAASPRCTPWLALRARRRTLKRSNNRMQWTALRTAADAERHVYPVRPKRPEEK
jgi:hypothetical protein